MANELIERAADAVIEELNRQRAVGGHAGVDWGDKIYCDEAGVVRAVLQAIREPSEAMTEAGSVASYDLEREGRAVEGEGANEIWRAMIDAALVETKQHA